VIYLGEGEVRREREFIYVYFNIKIEKISCFDLMFFFMNDYQQEVVLFIFGDLILFDIKIKIKSWKYHVYRMF
jgi:hypothetical protein